jgi:dihydrofolate reductase
VRKLIYGMNLNRDGYIAAPGDDIGWSGPPSDELFQWWLDQERASGLALYGRKLWETMSSYWPTGDQQPGATPAQIAIAQNWRDTRRPPPSTRPPRTGRRAATRCRPAARRSPRRR